MCDTLQADRGSVGIVMSSDPQALQLYPNLAKDVVNITLEFSHGRYEVYDYTGKLMTTGELNYGENTLNSSGLAPGGYLIRILENNMQVDVRRVVVIR